MNICDLGLTNYRKVHQMQLQCVEEELTGKSEHESVLITEHQPVFTLGRQGKTDGLIKSRQEITDKKIEIVHTERGGDITYHGPGQLVVYPILNLRNRKMSVSRYVYLLEEIMGKTVSDYNVAACRDKRNRGIWVNGSKLGSIGIRVRRGVSFHGFALNVNVSLLPFTWMNPCGLDGVTVTSLARELGEEVSMDEVKERVKYHVSSCFDKGVKE